MFESKKRGPRTSEREILTCRLKKLGVNSSGKARKLAKRLLGEERAIPEPVDAVREGEKKDRKTKKKRAFAYFMVKRFIMFVS